MFTCRTCGKQFKHESKNGRPRLYCSERCRVTQYTDAERARRKAALLAEQATWKQPRQCIACGVTYVPLMRKQEYCSLACRQTSPSKRGIMVDRTCVTCGKSFSVEPSRHNTANCDECHKNRPKDHLAKTVTCLQCGTRFHPRSDNKGYCSKPCGQKAYAKAHRHRQPPKPSVSRKTLRTCRVCQRNFVGAKTQYICSDACRSADRHMRCWARRSHYKETAMEPIDFDAICERDQWTCRICGKPVDPSLKWPNRGARSLDHIVPISQGGPHLYDNVQLTHLNCNWRKAKPHAKDGKAFHTPDHPHYPAPSQRTTRGHRGASKQGRTQPKRSDRPPSQAGHD